MRMIDEHVRQIRQHFGQPIRRHFLAKQKHLTEIPTSNFQHPEKNTKARKLLKRLISNGGCAGWMRVARSKINCPNFAVPGHNNTTYNPMKNDDMALVRDYAASQSEPAFAALVARSARVGNLSHRIPAGTARSEER